MLEAAIVVFVALTLIGVGRQAAGWWRRERVIRQLGEVSRISRGLSVRAIVTGVKTWRGLDARRRSRLTGDLVLAEDRFLLVTDRGVFIDVTGDPLRSVRCTGPGRLVIEGETGRDDGMFRFELVVEDAQSWAKALAGFVGAEGARFASFGA